MRFSSAICWRPETLVQTVRRRRAALDRAVRRVDHTTAHARHDARSRRYAPRRTHFLAVVVVTAEPAQGRELQPGRAPVEQQNRRAQRGGSCPPVGRISSLPSRRRPALWPRARARLRTARNAPPGWRRRPRFAYRSGLRRQAWTEAGPLETPDPSKACGEGKLLLAADDIAHARPARRRPAPTPSAVRIAGMLSPPPER